MMADDILDVAALGHRALVRRRQLRLEQEDVATAAGLSAAYISRLERGRIPNPKMQDLAAVARALDTTLDSLLRGSTSVLSNDEEEELRRLMAMPELAPDFVNLMKKANDATPQERSWLLQALRLLLSAKGIIPPFR